MKNALTLSLCIGVIVGNCYELGASGRKIAKRSRGDDSVGVPSPRVLGRSTADISERVAGYRAIRSHKEQLAFQKEITTDLQNAASHLRSLPGGKGISLADLMDQATCEEFNIDEIESLMQQMSGLYLASIPTTESREELDLADQVMRRMPAGHDERHSRAYEARLALAMVSETLDSFSKKKKYSKKDINCIENLKEQLFQHADDILDDPMLGDVPRGELQQNIQRIKDDLGYKLGSNADGRMIDPTMQVAAKTAIFAIEAMLKITELLSDKVSHLSVASDSALVARRDAYRWWGIRLTAMTLVLVGALVTGNAYGMIDIQTVPSVLNILTSTAGLLA